MQTISVNRHINAIIEVSARFVWFTFSSFWFREGNGIKFHMESYSRVHCPGVRNSEYVVSAGCAFIGRQQVAPGSILTSQMQQNYEKTNWKAKCISAWWEAVDL